MSDPNPNFDPLSQTQILQNVYDAEKQRLRTDSSITAEVDVEINVEIDASDGDNIAISNQAGTLKVEVTANNELQVSDQDTHDKLDIGNVRLASIDSKVSTAANQVSELTKLDTIHTDLLNIETKQDTGNASLASIDAGIPVSLGQTTMANSMPVVISSDQSTIQITGTVTANAGTGTFAVSAVSLPLPSGAATAAKQDVGNTSLSSIDGKLNSLGQKVSTASVPVVISSDQSAVPVSQNGTWNINNISGTVSLPTNAATETTLSSINGKFNSLGQKTMANSAPIVIASDQSPIPASQSGNWSTRTQDTAGNGITSQVSGAQRALDVGIDVAGVQVDPRQVRAFTASDIVTTQQGTSPWVVAGNVSSGATDTGNPVKTGGVFNTSLPTLTNGQRGDVQLDSSARIIIRPLVSSGDSVAAVQSGTWNINNVSGTVSLPTGASTEATLSTLNGKVNDNYGASSGGVRTSSQIGNITGAADFNSGVTGAQTLRTAANLYDGSANALTSQVNGSKRALDVGVNVSGVQVDPRTVSVIQTTSPVVKTTGTVSQITSDEYARISIVSTEATNAEWGGMFHASSNQQILSGTTETPFLYFQNPNGSGKSAKIFRMNFEPTLGNNYVTYRIYTNPTVTANGTAVTEVGNRQTGQSSNIVNVFTIPTTSANGSLMKTLVCSGLAGLGRDVLYNFSLWIEANNSLLVTRQLSANATVGGVSIEWVEQ